MDIFKEIRERADIVKVAEYYGLRLDRAYKCVCPFHKEKTASLSFSQSKQIFKCFGCGISGDCITLVSKILNITPLESAKQINYIFSLGIDLKGSTSKYEANRYKQIQESKERFKNWHNKTLQMLCDYLHSLKGIEKLQKTEIVEYYIDLLIYGTEEDWLWFKKTEERWCKTIERRMGAKIIS